jgi:uncharacterized protein YbaP (TraB family)
MFSQTGRLFLLTILVGLAFSSSAYAGHACVWKVTGPGGGVLYLGGSIHALRSTDYPLPGAYNRAFDASERLVIEDDPNVSPSRIKRLRKSAQYPKGDSLKNHFDPRAYDYLRRVFALMNVSEDQFARLRPWALIMELWSPSLSGLSSELGIEDYLIRRARANRKPVSGLESFEEHVQVLSGLSDRQAEAVILLTFIPQQGGESVMKREMEAWRHGDADAIARLSRLGSEDFPAFRERMIDARNRNWIPKIERDLRSGHVYFVVAGAAHMGGPNGVVALLRARGYRVEQL